MRRPLRPRRRHRSGRQSPGLPQAHTRSEPQRRPAQRDPSCNEGKEKKEKKEKKKEKKKNSLKTGGPKGSKKKSKNPDGIPGIMMIARLSHVGRGESSPATVSSFRGLFFFFSFCIEGEFPANLTLLTGRLLTLLLTRRKKKKKEKKKKKKKKKTRARIPRENLKKKKKKKKKIPPITPHGPFHSDSRRPYDPVDRDSRDDDRRRKLPHEAIRRRHRRRRVMPFLASPPGRSAQKVGAWAHNGAID